MIHVEQKHHSTQNLAPCPGAICKTLRSNTRASYDPQQGDVSRKGTLGRTRGEIKMSHNIQERQWHKKDTGGKFTDHEFVIRQTVTKRDSKHSSKITTIQFIHWQKTLTERILTTVVRGFQCIYIHCQSEQTNKQTFTSYTKQISTQTSLIHCCSLSAFLYFLILMDSCPEVSSVFEQKGCRSNKENITA